jgi:hypothetical protein
VRESVFCSIVSLIAFSKNRITSTSNFTAFFQISGALSEIPMKGPRNIINKDINSSDDIGKIHGNINMISPTLTKGRKFQN